jgi:hypothetical protein
MQSQHLPLTMLTSRVSQCIPQVKNIFFRHDILSLIHLWLQVNSSAPARWIRVGVFLTRMLANVSEKLEATMNTYAVAFIQMD